MAYLLQPLTLGSIKLKNRLVMPPIVTNKADDRGFVTCDMLDFYREKTEGGYIGLVIVENSYIAREGKFDTRQLTIAEDSAIGGLRDLANALHDNGSKCIMQINHAGTRADSWSIGSIPGGPSSTEDFRGRKTRELEHKEIAIIIKAFGDAATRAASAGFDGVEIHSAHGFLLNQFYSPLTNKRIDRYGGDVRNRIRIHQEVIHAVRTVVSKEFIISLRLGASDYMQGGTTIEDSLIAAGHFEEAGVNILSISGGLLGFTIPGDSSQGYFSPLSEVIKRAVTIPVILTGGIRDVQSAEEMLTQEKADLIGVGRAIFKDSHWAANALTSLSQAE